MPFYNYYDIINECSLNQISKVRTLLYTKFTHATIKTYKSVSNYPAHNFIQIRNICSFDQLIINLNSIKQLKIYLNWILFDDSLNSIRVQSFLELKQRLFIKIYYNYLTLFIHFIYEYYCHVFIAFGKTTNPT